MNNPHAKALGEMAAGKKKNFSQAERNRRRKRIAEARKLIGKRKTQ
jgi:hypothetical protein